MFSTLPYLDWIRGRPETATHDLGSSDLRPGGHASDPELVPPRLRDVSEPNDERSVAAAVAAEYGVEESQVLVTAGATHANFLVAATAVALAEERATESAAAPVALVEQPGYGPLARTPESVGARVERFERPDGEVVPERVAERVTTPLALSTVTNRHNPTGRLTDRDTIARTAAAVADTDGYLHVDEVYAPYGGSDESSGRGGKTAFGGPTAAGLSRTVVTSSLTKFHGLGALRIGWIVGPEQFVERAESVRSYVPAVAEPSEALARRFFANRDRLLAEARDHCRQNHDLFQSFDERRDDVTMSLSEGCPFGLLTHETADGDTLSRAAWAEDVLVVPGRFFGVPDSVRVSLGRAPEHCSAALDALADVLDTISTEN